MDALVVIDMQVGLRYGGPKHDLADVIVRINRLAATMRAMVSELDPAANGTTSLIGRSGHSADAGAVSAAVATDMDTRN